MLAIKYANDFLDGLVFLFTSKLTIPEKFCAVPNKILYVYALISHPPKVVFQTIPVISSGVPAQVPRQIHQGVPCAMAEEVSPGDNSAILPEVLLLVFVLRFLQEYYLESVMELFSS